MTTPQNAHWLEPEDRRRQTVRRSCWLDTDPSSPGITGTTAPVTACYGTVAEQHGKTMAPCCWKKNPIPPHRNNADGGFNCCFKAARHRNRRFALSPFYALPENGLPGAGFAAAIDPARAVPCDTRHG